MLEFLKQAVYEANMEMCIRDSIQLAQEGKGVLFISSEIEEMLRTCNRLAVLRDGAKVGELSGDMTQEKVMKTIAEG